MNNNNRSNINNKNSIPKMSSAEYAGSVYSYKNPLSNILPYSQKKLLLQKFLEYSIIQHNIVTGSTYDPIQVTADYIDKYEQSLRKPKRFNKATDRIKSGGISKSSLPPFGREGSGSSF